jgi:TonB family protein
MSTPRPARSEASATTARPIFCWTFPGAPIRIHVPLDLVSRLRADLGQHESSGYRIPSVEAGGVLLGHRLTATSLEIDDYLWISSREPSGRGYSLDISALKRLREESSARDENGRRAEVVGYFRTQAEDDLHLRGEELDLVTECFRDPTDVVLLIRNSDEPYTSGFLFWTQEGDFVPFSLLDFPLDAGLLHSDAIGALTSQPTEDGEMDRVLPTITNLPASTKNTPRLAESASASNTRPISTSPEDVSFNLRLRSHPRWPHEHRSSSTADGQVNEAEPRETTPRPEPAHIAPPRATVASPKHEPTPLPTPAGMAARSRQEPSRVSPRMLAAIVVLLALVAVSAFLLRGRGAVPKQKAPATVAAFPLQLDVQAQGEGLNIRWNPQSVPVTQAREGRLTILEGNQQPPRIIPLDVQQLTSGHIYYRSSAERVQFQLEIVDNSGGASKESVLALSSQQAPVRAGNAPPPGGNGQGLIRKVESIPIPSTNAGAFQLADTTEAPTNRPAPRAFAAPPSIRDRAGKIPAITLDQPPAILTNNAPPPTVVLPATLSNLPVNIPPAPQGKEPAAKKQIRIGSLQAANLIKSVAPIYPPLAMSQHMQGTVRFSATIGKDGTVQNLQLISGNPALVKAATDAVKQWLYRPALLNGDPIEVITQIDVKFALSQ